MYLPGINKKISSNSRVQAMFDINERAKFQVVHLLQKLSKLKNYSIQILMHCEYKNSHAAEPFCLQYQVMDDKEERRKKDRERYARMTKEEKEEKLKKRREAYQRNKTIKEAKKAYIETAHEGGTSILNVKERKHVTPGERQAFLHRRNEEFSTKQRKTVSESSEEDNGNNDIEPLKQPQVLINGKPSLKRYFDATKFIYSMYN